MKLLFSVAMRWETLFPPQILCQKPWNFLGLITSLVRNLCIKFHLGFQPYFLQLNP